MQVNVGLKFVERKGDVVFAENEKGKLFQSLDGENYFPVKDGEMTYKHIQKVGDVAIKYNANGCYGYAIFDRQGACLEDGIWTMDKAKEVAEFCRSKGSVSDILANAGKVCEEVNNGAVVRDVGEIEKG